MSLRQTDDNCQRAQAQWIEKMFQKTAVLQHILYIKIKEGDIRRVVWNQLVADEGGKRK